MLSQCPVHLKTPPAEMFRNLKEATVPLKRAGRPEAAGRIPVDAVKEKFESAYDEYRRRAKVDGFRPGKAPMAIIKKRYASDIKQDVLEEILPKAYEQALIAQKLFPLNAPKLTDVEFEEGQPLKFKAEFEVRPKVELKKYTGFRLEKKIPVVGDKEIQESLDYLRDRLAEYQPVQRPSENGDLVIADLIKKHFDLRPKGIVQMLDLLRPIYLPTAAYGLFGRTEAGFSWERTDKAEALREAAGIKPRSSASA